MSVIICTSGRPASLQNCLESLTKQKSQVLFEVIVVKSDSDEKTQKVINGFLQKLNLKTIPDPQNGLAAARDIGWRKAEAEIVSWIDDDVVVENNWLESILKIFAENHDIGGVSGPTLIPKILLANRDIFSFYKNGGRELSFLGKIWAWFFLDNKPFAVGKLFKSGAWSPGSNFPQCLKINGLKEVDYLEACNMSLRKDLVEKVSGFDLGFQGTAEWCEIDLAQKVKKLGQKLVFNPEAIVYHHISRSGAFTKRTMAKERMENFFRFYFRHVFKPDPEYILRFSAYVLFLNFYWLFKAVSTLNLDWLGGWLGTITGLRFILCKTRKI